MVSHAHSHPPLPGALLLNADLSGAQMQEVVMSKAYAVGTNFKGEAAEEGYDAMEHTWREARHISLGTPRSHNIDPLPSPLL